MLNLGNRTEDSTINFKWSTNAGDGSSITRGTNGTVSVYKSNSDTQSTAGITDTEDFDSLTGIHHCAIDLSADAFYATGQDYDVVLSAATIDGKTVNAVLAHFTIELGHNEVDVVKWLGTACATPTNAGVPEVDLTHINGSLTDGSPVAASRPKLYLQQLSAVCDIASQGALHLQNSNAAGRGINAVGVLYGQYNSGAIGQVNSGSQAGQSNSGSLNYGQTNAGPTAGVSMSGGVDLLLTGSGTIEDDAGDTVAMSSEIATAQADLDILTGSDGVTLATSQPNYAPAKAGDQMDLINAPNATAVGVIAASVWSVVVAGSYTALQIMRGIAAALLGKLSGAGTSTETFRSVDDSKDVITATVNAAGDRTAVTKDLD